MKTDNPKYPRTYHVPWSPGTTSDDKKLSGDWFDNYRGKEIIITEKLDGENNAINHYDVFARSHGAPTRSPWTRNIWDNDGILWQIKDKIGETEVVYGENLFGEHSIKYNKLTNYWHIFAVTNGDIWYSWDDVRTVADILKQPHVPILWRGILYEENDLKRLIDKFMSEPSTYGVEKEGCVIRVVDEFPFDDFSKYVCKWVRPNHVQTGEHWTKNWKRAKLMWEYNNG